MADITSNLFPEVSSLFRQQDMQAGINAANMAQGGYANAALAAGMQGAAMAGSRLGRTIGGLLGGTTPEQDEATATKAIADELAQQGVNLQSGDGMMQMAQRLMQQGKYNAAQKAAAAANILREKEASIGLHQAQTAKITEASANEANYKKALETLGPNPTQEQLAAIAIKFAPASEAAKIMQTSADKAAAREQAKTIAEEKLQSAKEKQKAEQEFKIMMANLTASLKGSSNDLQRQLLQARIDDLTSKQEEKKAAQLRQEEGAIASFDDALSTASIIQKHPGKTDVVGRLLGKTRAAIPGTDAAGFVDQLETFKAQTFLPQVQKLKGMGALSDAEGKKLTAAVGALSINMKEKEFDTSLNRIINTLNDAKQRVVATSRVLPKTNNNTTTPEIPVAGQGYADPEKERRYQEYKKSKGF